MVKKILLTKVFAGKKGGNVSESDKLLFWLFFVLPLLILIVIFVSSFITSIKNMYLNPEVEPLVYESRLLYSPNCFAYADQNGRTYVGVIDPAKFNEYTLRECIPLEGGFDQALAVELKVQSGQVIDYLKTENWDMKMKDSIIAKNYVVEVKGNGYGIMTFYHKT